jgi:hypothetical protein
MLSQKLLVRALLAKGFDVDAAAFEDIFVLSTAYRFEKGCCELVHAAGYECCWQLVRFWV